MTELVKFTTLRQATTSKRTTTRLGKKVDSDGVKEQEDEEEDEDGDGAKGEKDEEDDDDEADGATWS